MAGKKYGTSSFPKSGLDATSLLARAEAILTPELLKSRFLHGIPMADYTDDELKDQIEMAINEIELHSNIRIHKMTFKEKLPYDANLYKSFIHLQVNNRPVLEVLEVTVESSDGQIIYKMPLEWLELGQALKGQVNMIPLMSKFGATGISTGGVPTGAMIFLLAQQNYNWLPSFWAITYVSGCSHEEGMVPIVINQLIGAMAAISILSNKQANNRNTSQMLSQDGITQSSSGPGPNLYKTRIEDLEKKKQDIMEKLKCAFSSRFFMTNI